MRILLISYEFPPIESAQALRWKYLARHLRALGVQVTVIAPEVIKGAVAGNSFEANVIRSYPGPFVGVSGWLSRRSANKQGKLQVTTGSAKESKAELAYRMLRKGLDKLIFPDVRSEWYPFALRSIAHLKPDDIDIVIASHEPGVDLMLGQSVSKRLKAPLVIDLADPLVTPYSPRWRKYWDTKLERESSQYAAGVITTSERFSQSIIEKYGIAKSKVIEIEQGFEAVQNIDPVLVEQLNLPGSQFWLLFTGNFYQDFRNPVIFLQALKQRPNIKFVFAGSSPSWLTKLFGPLGDQIVCLGRLSHQQTIAIQREAPALFNLGNQQSMQIPGKIFEYFGAGRPILHVALNPNDPSGELLEKLGRGVGAADNVDQIITILDRMENAYLRNSMAEEWSLGIDAVAKFSWLSLSEKLLTFLNTCKKG